MKEIALAILAVGLCFYQALRLYWGLGADLLAGLVAIVASIAVLI